MPFLSLFKTMVMHLMILTCSSVSAVIFLIFILILRYVVWIWKIWFAAKVERIEKWILCFYFIFLKSYRPRNWNWCICKYGLPWIFSKFIFSTGKLICDCDSDCGKINPEGYGFRDSSNFCINNSTLLLCMGLSLSSLYIWNWQRASFPC